jgi:hypothetical protein
MIVKSKLFYFFVIYALHTENIGIENGRETLLDEDVKT